LALPLAAVLGACSEELDTGASCPLLCPGQEIVVRDTVIEPAYVFDTSLVGYPIQGLEFPLLLAARGDTLDVRAVVRFDTLQRRYTPVGDTAQAITMIDSAYLSLRLYSRGFPVPARFTLEAFDVADSTLVDSLPATLTPLFVPERLLGAIRIDSSDYNDSTRVRIPLDSAKIRAIVTDPARKLRIGLRVSSSTSVQFRMTPYSPGGDGATLEYRVSPDTSVARVAGIEPSSTTPATPVFVAGDFVDYSIVVTAPNVLAPGTFSVGGLPAARSYLRFNLPRWLTDSVAVLRASLELTQDPVRGLSDRDTLSILTHLVVANGTVTDLRRAATLITASGLFTNTLRLAPGDSGVRVLEMNGLVRQWGLVDSTANIPSAIVFRTDTEGSSPATARFFSIDAADPSVRPRLRVSYTPSKIFGRP
jgi:hypothetical protein